MPYLVKVSTWIMDGPLLKILMFVTYGAVINGAFTYCLKCHLDTRSTPPCTVLQDGKFTVSWNKNFPLHFLYIVPKIRQFE